MAFMPFSMDLEANRPRDSVLFLMTRELELIGQQVGAMLTGSAMTDRGDRVAQGALRAPCSPCSWGSPSARLRS
jgi:hypothetical protein